MKKESRSKYLLKNTAIFTLSNFASKLISFFIVPLYTSILSTTEYGTVDLITTICTIVVPIMTLNIMESVMRFGLDSEIDKNKITKIGIIVLFYGSIIGLLLIPICSLWNQTRDYGLLIYFYVICSAASQIFLSDLRGKEQLLYYSIGNILNTILIAGFNIIFLLVFKMGVIGYILAYTLSSAFVASFALFVGKGYKAVNLSIDVSKMKEMLKYSVVLIPNSFMWWIMNSSDHVMVTSMVGVAANGVYAISYKIPTLLTTIVGVFNQAWCYSAIREEDAEDSDDYTNRIFFSLRGIVFIAGILMITITKPFLGVYVAADYFESWRYTPFLIIGCVYLTMATFMSTSYTVHKDSKGFLLSGLFGAIINIFFNFLLIPVLSVYGAAIATCISYIAVFAFRKINTEKYINYKIIDKEFLLGTLGLLVNSILMFFDGMVYHIFQIVITLLIIFILKKAWLPFMRSFITNMRKRAIK